MKTHVLTVSRFFPSHHPRKGEPTNFPNLILGGRKKHTIRQRYEYWEPKIKEVQEGKARLSVRYWNGLPYRSPQEEFLSLTGSEVQIQKISIKFDRNKNFDSIEVGDSFFSYDNTNPGPKNPIFNNICYLDGFDDEQDLIQWFQGKDLIDVALIYFENYFKYQ